MLPPASAAGTSRTSTAPGPKLSTTRPRLASVSARREHAVGIDRIELDDLGHEQELAGDAGAGALAL